MFNMASAEEMKKEMGSSYLNTSFCGLAKIVKMERVSSSTSASQGIKLVVETEKGEGNFQIWYKKKDGSSNDYGVKQLTAIMGIVKLDPKKFEVEIDHDNFGNEHEMIKMSKPVECGLYLEAKLEEYNGKERTKLEFKGAFDPRTKKTPAESLNNTEAKMYKSWEKAVEGKKEVSVKKEEVKTNNSISDTDFNEEEFPF